MADVRTRWVRIAVAVAVLLFVMVGALLVSGCGPDDTEQTDDTSTEGTSVDGETLVETKCSACHGLDRVTDADVADREAWESIVNRMVGHGLSVTSEEKSAILDHLETL